jgi:hypothetical protein
MRKSTGILLTLLSFFVGLALGCLLSPKGCIGNNNGNTNYYGIKKEEIKNL